MVVCEKEELEVSWKVHWQKYGHQEMESWVHQRHVVREHNRQ